MIKLIFIVSLWLGHSMSVSASEATESGCKDIDNISSRGIVLILNGVSSSGKSTLVQSLLKGLDSSWKVIAMDDIEDDDEESEEECDFDEDDAIFFEMGKRVNALTAQGFNVICDAVLLGSMLESFVTKVEAVAAYTFTVLVYCPLESTLNNVIARNSRALSPHATDIDIQGGRTPCQPVQQFMELYQVTDEQAETPVGSLSLEALSTVKSLLSMPYPLVGGKKGASLMLSSKSIERLIDTLQSVLHLDECERVKSISPRSSYSLVVDSTKKGASLHIVDFVNSKMFSHAK